MIPIVLLVAALCLASVPSVAQEQAAKAPLPNLVVVSPKLATAGQPTREYLEQLGAQGYEAVVYLAPPSVPDAVPDEGAVVGRQGLAYINIPIRFGNPTEQDFELFAATLDALKRKKVLVHCQVNMRASSMVFLYRVLALKEDPERAYQDVAKVWSPNGEWKQFIASMLRKNKVAFEPY
ncbi:MAG TPA: protein tyrosine phosphatase family protein [Paucimonas sp.]|nr:protein tyrosine phosphatase family protein [Paucimonas sp.]